MNKINEINAPKEEANDAVPALGEKDFKALFQQFEKQNN
jgi:hypothetical protein